MENLITNRNGHLSSVSGDKAMEALRLRVIIISLEFRRDVGHEMDRRFNTIKIAQTATGLKTRDIERLILACRNLQTLLLADCQIIGQ